ncbi:hypothetical protein CAEBREN_14873 [Caenorhabditis brenneri]|uniref:Uncharacterized protein n=1 Tax=Caenorhabditis brenneri TaxID=135651 RepID=G0MR20_CAEBE|nr:hypothetical protein CAEBREN_14873 [Caenorhabditis brenneri]
MFAIASHIFFSLPIFLRRVRGVMVSMDAFQAFDGELSPKGNTEESNKKPDKFMEDLIEVQRTYRSLKEKWHRMMVEKNQVIQAASSTPPPAIPISIPIPTSTSSSEIQEIDIDVFEAPDKFQDISSDKSEFDDEAFVDISVTAPTTVAVQPSTTSHVASELDQIQNAIQEAFGGTKDQGKEQKISLSEIISPKVAVQMDGVVTTVRMDQTTPIPLPTSTPASDEGRIIPQNFNGPVMLNARTTGAPKPEAVGQEVKQPTVPILDNQQQIAPNDQIVNTLQQGDQDQNASIPQQAPPVPAPPQLIQQTPPPMVPNELTAVSGPTGNQDQVVPNLQQVEPGPIENPQTVVTPNLSNTQHDLPSPHGVSNPIVKQGLPILQQEKSLISTFGANRPAPFPRVATPWRHKMESMDHVEDPFEPVTLPSTQQALSTTSELPTTSTTTALPMHILPTSSFHSSGVHPDSLPATNLFRYPDQVKIPFFGAKSENSEGSLETAGPVRPTTPEPFRSDEIQNLEDVEQIEEHKKPGDLRIQESELSNPETLEDPDDNEEVEVDSETDSDIESISEGSEDNGEEITTSEEVITTTPRGIENNEDYVEDTFSQEMPLGSEPTASNGKVPESFGIGKAPSFEESVMEPGSDKTESEPSDVFGSPPGSPTKPRPKAFGSVPSSSGPVESGFGNFGSPPGLGSSGPSGLGTFGSKRGPSAPDFEAIIPDEPSRPSGPKQSDSMNALEGLNDLLDGVSLRAGPNGPSGQLGSPPGSIGSGSPVPPVTAPPMAPSGFGSFGIGRSPPGFSEPVGPTLPPSARPQKPSFPTLVEQVENFFNEEDNVDTGASSALGSFGSDEVVGNVPVSQNIQVLGDPKPRPTRPPMHMATSRNPIGIFGTKLQTINQKAYKPPMFSSALDSKAVKMVQLGNPYLTRTTVQPIGPHGLAEPVMSVDTELPAWNGVEKDHGIINKARREYQKEFEQQIRDVRIIDEEINRISKMNDDGRSKTAQRCSQVYAHTLSLPQIQKMSHSLGLGDVAAVIQKAADLTENQENDIAQLELDLEEKRKLIAKVEILLSLAESRALLFDLLNEQKKIAEKMENHALDLLQKTNFRPQTPSPFSAASDISELSSAVQQVLNSKSAASKKGWSMMKRKLHKKSKTPKKFEVIEPSDVVIKNSFMEFNKKAGHLQETAEIVEPVLTVPFVSQNDKFGRHPVAKSLHIRPIPLAPPTMSPKILTLIPRPFQMAAHHHTVSKPLAPPGANEADTVHELIDMLHEDIVKLPAEEEERICRQVQCDFEKADLCNYESSHDETTRLRLLKSKSHRQKRSSALMPGITDDLLAEPSNIADDLLPYTFRAWSIWAGRRADRTKQIDIGPNFSSRNHHFAAVFLEPQQAGILSIPLVLSPTSTKIRLRLFEGTRGIRLRICCDRYCPMETEQGLYRGHRSWLRKTVTCPANTQTLSFECLNDGPDRGACGVDEVFVDSNRCHQYFNGSDQN